MRDELIAPPTVEPVSRATAKLYLRSTTTSEDALIDSIVSAARGYIEQYCSRALVLQTRRRVLDAFPRCIELEWGPVRSVLSIQYLDLEGALQTFDSANYRVDKVSRMARITLEEGESWPSTYAVPNAVRVNYTAGMLLPFTAEPQSPPSDLITVAGHGFADGEVTQVQSIGGELPGGLAAATNYYVRDATANTLRLAATSGGDAIDITSAGTAPNCLGRMDKEIEQSLQLLVQYFEQRDASAHILAAAESLLGPFRLIRA